MVEVDCNGEQGRRKPIKGAKQNSSKLISVFAAELSLYCRSAFSLEKHAVRRESHLR